MDDPIRRKERAALVSIFISVALTLGKVVAGVLTGSLALLSEAANNLGDTGVTIVTYFVIKIAHKPADDDHPFGHGKVEALAALAETGLLFAVSISIAIEAVRRLVDGLAAVQPNALGFAVLGLSIIVDLGRWRMLSRIARETRSDALAADALNFATDIIGSALALAGLGAAAAGYPQADAIAALAVALFIAVAGFRLARRTINTLIDAAPVSLVEPIRATARDVPGVAGVKAVRLRRAGSETLGEIAIQVARTLPLDRVAAIRDEVAKRIGAAHPGVALTVSDQPLALDDETILERILLIAAKRHVPVHNILVQAVDERLSISFDVEIDSRMPHGRAHEIASALEAAVADELGSAAEVETHIEPLHPSDLVGEVVTADLQAAVAAALAERAPNAAVVSRVHDVRVRRTPAGLIVNYHCQVDPALSVAEVHDQVDRLDRRMRLDFPEIVRIVGHAEPLRPAI